MKVALPLELILSNTPNGAGSIRGGKKISVDFVASPSERITKHVPGVLEQSHCICSRQRHTLRKTTSGMLVGAGNDGMPEHIDTK